MRSPSFNGTRACAKLVHLVETNKLRKGRRVGKKPYKNRGLGGICLLDISGFCTPKVRVKQRDAPQRHNGTEMARKFRAVFGVIFVRVRSLYLTRFLGTILKEKSQILGIFFLLRLAVQITKIQCPFKWGRITGPCVPGTDSSAYIFVYIYIYVF